MMQMTTKALGSMFMKLGRTGLLLALLFGSVSYADIVYVDASNQTGIEDGTQANPYSRIRTAMFAAVSGDRILVAAGVYHETVVMRDNIDLVGEDPATTVLDGTGLSNPVVAFHGTSQETRLQGFTITGGSGGFIDTVGGVPVYAGGGIAIFDASPTITNNIVTGNSLTTGIVRGGGIYVNTITKSPIIAGNVVSNNVALSEDQDEEGRGGGIYIVSKLSSVLVADNVIELNQAYRGGGVFSENIGAASLKVLRNVIQFNEATDGAAIYTKDFSTSTSTVSNNLIYGNVTNAVPVIDCDDANSGVSPVGVEVCADGLDNDCDPSTLDLFDSDGDGHPCDVDCDDSDATIYPGAPEHCLDEIDNDCDGSIDVLNPDNVVWLEFGDETLYLANEADPSLGLSWVATDFVDTAWSVGSFGVGYETNSPGGAENLLLTSVPTAAASVYTRTRFQIDSLASVNGLYLGADYDDGYVAWINGVEVYRSPEMAAGDPPWDADPSSHESSNGESPDYGVLVDITTVGLGELVEGENVLAIGVYADFPASSTDLVLVPKLSAAVGTTDADCSCADADGDGYAGETCAVDCDDADPDVNPGTIEVCNDGVDNDCDVGTSDVPDADGDGYTCALDCDDAEAEVNPGVAELKCDGLDNDCNPTTPDVQDGDGDFFACNIDCDDGNPAINPDAPEFCFDGVDNNCDGLTDDSDNECACAVPQDLDGDGYRCTDCDDGNPSVNPGANELCGDGIDNDCSPFTDDIFDEDGDGTLCDVDCPDTDPAFRSDAIEICNDGLDNDCDLLIDGLDDDCMGCADGDGDGYPSGADLCDVDCDDTDAEVHPGASEICNDGKDNDCDVATPDLADVDGDGYDCLADCNDGDAAISPGAAEHCRDGIDNDCDLLIDVVSSDAALVKFGSPMRYLANETDPGIGLSWILSTFNDNPWSNGLYGVGYQVGPPGTGASNLIATTVPVGTASVYTRSEFTISDITGVNALYLGADWDDGYVAWINGVEVYRSPEMPVGDPLWDANPELHESSNGGVPDYGTLIDISTPGIAALTDGVNVLAVGLYNDIPVGGGASSDLVIVPRLSMDFGSNDEDCLCDDIDGDGYTGGTCAIDCDDSEELINPGMIEIGCDLVDNDCDIGTDDDQDNDGDGSTCTADCNDSDPTDNDCNLGTPDVVDGDNDGVNCLQDCDDENDQVRPGLVEIGCDTLDNDCDTLTADIRDSDGDGYFCNVECDDTNAAIHPGAFEKCDDTVDNDCDTLTDVADDECFDCVDTDDTDGDGYICTDCNDDVAAVNPAAAEECDDGVDNDCDPATLDLGDADGDGFDCTVDCDDSNFFVRPGALEVCGDGIDNDCDPVGTPDVFDFDGDTYGCDIDCNDADAAVHPDAVELCNDATDNDCDPSTLDIIDFDGDTFDCAFDCDDENAAINPGEAEVCDDGIDNDCNAATADVSDVDGDGYMCNAECDDTDATIHPGIIEQCTDGIDNDCDTDTDSADADCTSCPDSDGDGYACGDCDDGRSIVNPGMQEICQDTFDNDCDGTTPDFGDLDGDGYNCDVDCDDHDVAVNPAAVEICGDGIDNDCDLVGTPDLFDNDADLYDCSVDCDDSNPNINPGQVDVGCDGIDNDCNVLTPDLSDVDGDNYFCADPGVRGGGVSSVTFDSARVTIVNNTLVANDMLPLGHGGALYLDDMMSGNPGLVANNIFYDNSAFLGGGIDHTSYFGEILNNAYFMNNGGDEYDSGGSTATKTANVVVDPQFVSLPYGNFRLSPGSPLIDAADAGAAPEDDLDRVPRPFDGDGDLTPQADLGAYEYPSAEVLELVFLDKNTASWAVREGEDYYSLYRGTLRRLELNGTYTQDPTAPYVQMTCLIPAASVPWIETFEPVPTWPVFYLVTVSGRIFEGSLGTDSNGALRSNDNPCP
jgi:hypothetical protein